MGGTVTWKWVVTHTGDYGEVVTNTVEYEHWAAGEGSAEAQFDVKTKPALQIDKAVSPSEAVDYRVVVTYSVQLTNMGESPAVGTLLTDTLRDEVEFAWWVAQNEADETDDEITWTGTVPAEQSVSWSWVVTHTGQAYAARITNTVEVTHPVGGRATDDAVFTVKTGPAFSIEKSVVSDENVDYHGIVTYTVELSNSGDSLAEDVYLTDTLPGKVEFGWWVQQSDASEADGDIRWRGTVTGLSSVTWQWVVTHTGSYSEDVTNWAEYAHWFGGTGSDSATFDVKTAPSLTINKGVTPERDVQVGDAVTYTVTVENEGESAAG